jgi:DNA-binding IclR family transcriptional regulator
VKRTGGAQEVTGAESVKKVFKLMLSFTVERPLLTVADLAAELGFPKSSVYRYVALLRELGMLEETSDGLHRVTLRLLPLARAALAAASTDPTQVAHGFIERVAAETGETTLLMQRVAHHVVAVDIVESPHAVRLAFERGKPMTLHLGSGGRLLMSAMTHAERAAYRSERRRSSAGTQDIPTNRELDRIAAEGWVESYGQVEEGIWGVSAVVRNGSGPVAALGLAGPERRTLPRRMELIETVRTAAAQLSQLLVQAEELR